MIKLRQSFEGVNNCICNKALKVAVSIAVAPIAAIYVVGHYAPVVGDSLKTFSQYEINPGRFILDFSIYVGSVMSFVSAVEYCIVHCWYRSISENLELYDSISLLQYILVRLTCIIGGLTAFLIGVKYIV